LHLIVGLGNPGARYAQTRHNVGWAVLDHAARRWSIRLESAAGARQGRGRVGARDVVLAAPVDWMNQTGPIVRRVLDECGVSPLELIVIHDDLDLELGRIRIKQNGGSGGHNGILSVTTALETNDYYRLKLGIGRPTPGMDPADYVLAPFSASEMSVLDQVLDQAVLALECFVVEGSAAAMNRFNVRPKEEDSAGMDEFETE
jgi:PTH1 family peptidyl-tRNA hydrolase